jgi:nitrous oxide reductase accessory protein NosL
MCHRCAPGLSRRRLVRTAGAVGLGSVAGCLSGSGGGDVPEPVALTGNKQCELCGMIIEQHPGPVGQLFYEDEGPDHEGPAWFCSGWETFKYQFDRREMGWKLVVGYMTDYASVDYDLYEDGGNTFITAHVEASAFARLQDLYYVVGTPIRGAMGEDLIPFSERDAADSFATDHGGEVYEYGDVTPTLVGQIGY